MKQGYSYIHLRKETEKKKKTLDNTTTPYREITHPHEVKRGINSKPTLTLNDALQQ